MSWNWGSTDWDNNARKCAQTDTEPGNPAGEEELTDRVLMMGSGTPRMAERLGGRFTVHKDWETPGLEAIVSEHAEEIVAVAIYGAARIDAALMARLPNLQIISNYGVGYDAVDVAAALARRIPVTHTPGVLDADVANLAIGLVLAVSRRIVRDDAWVRTGKWKSAGNAPLTRSIEGARIGMVGMGRIGVTIARKMEAAFGCSIAYHTRSPRPDLPYAHHEDLVEMAGQVDCLIIITPGGAATRHLVNAAVIDALGPQGMLVNVARGTVVDEAALVAALEEGRLGSAGLDVFENEPHVPEALFGMDNVVLLPHVGSATEETRRAMGDLTVDNILSWFAERRVLTPVPECADMPEILGG